MEASELLAAFNVITLEISMARCEFDKNSFKLSSSVNGAMAVERRQQSATSTAHWQTPPPPSRPSTAGLLAS
ncbi:hypothetical protein RB195_021546 [Necator americanus]|uniref:Uncharacterized protein n=1 Tax=Necator americanus TaxID=51031 RepID=A0ABR1EBJ4_NECAM